MTSTIESGRWDFIFLHSVSALDAPSPAEVKAGLNLTPSMLEADGWTNDGDGVECSVTLDARDPMVDVGAFLPTLQKGVMLLFDSADGDGMTFPVRVIEHRAGGDPDHITVVFDTGSAVPIAQGHCVHLDVEPVASISGQVVAHLCRTCDEKLPAGWRP